jgi:hypothetical protein
VRVTHIPSTRTRVSKDIMACSSKQNGGDLEGLKLGEVAGRQPEGLNCMTIVWPAGSVTADSVQTSATPKITCPSSD